MAQWHHTVAKISNILFVEEIDIFPGRALSATASIPKADNRKTLKAVSNERWCRHTICWYRSNFQEGQIYIVYWHWLSGYWPCYLGMFRSERKNGYYHYGDAIMSTMASQVTSLTIVYSTVYSGADQRSHHKGLVTRKMFPFYDVIMIHIALQVRYESMRILISK